MKPFAAALLGTFTGAIFIVVLLVLFKPQFISEPNTKPAPDRFIVRTPQSFSQSSSIPDAVDNIFPSVVYIDTKIFKEVSTPIYDIFGVPSQRSQMVPASGSGSGVVIDASGLILTNEHVIHGANEIMVTFSDDKSYPATIKGSDLVSDIALIQVSGVKVTPAKLGDSDALRIGESVIAVGSPYHFSKTVTSGVLSGRGRELSDQSKEFGDLLQTDAAINPGNSGGPLVNLKGEVIGINTAIIPFAQGIGFAIPINTVKNIVDQLLTTGKVIRPYIGVAMLDLNAKLSQYLGISLEKGIIVTGVAPDGPAAFSGLRPRDIITKINGKSVDSSEDLRRSVRKSKPGDMMELSVVRNNREASISIKIGKRE